MKTLLVCLCLIGNFSFAKTIHIDIHIKGIKEGTLIYLENEDYKDSTVFKNETARFSYNKKDTLPTQLKIYTKDKTLMMAPFIDNQDLSINGILGDDSRKFIYTGSKTNTELLEYLNAEQEQHDAIKIIWAKYGRISGEDAIRQRKLKLDSVEKILIEKDMAFTSKYPSSYLTPGLPLFAYRNHKIDKQQAIKWFNTLPNETKNTKLGQDFLLAVNKYNTLHKGDTAPEIAVLDEHKKLFKLSAYRDKDILLIFWASWCGPCRAELPTLKKIQKENPGLQLISFSLDDNENQWHKAINELKIPWINISDLNGLASEVGLAYGISAVPHVVYIKKGIVDDANFNIWNFHQ
jgi:thiol-disulfide isomerase/thioredoxin